MHILLCADIDNESAKSSEYKYLEVHNQGTLNSLKHS